MSRVYALGGGDVVRQLLSDTAQTQFTTIMDTKQHRIRTSQRRARRKEREDEELQMRDGKRRRQYAEWRWIQRRKDRVDARAIRQRHVMIGATTIQSSDTLAANKAKHRRARHMKLATANRQASTTQTHWFSRLNFTLGQATGVVRTAKRRRPG